MIELKPPNEHRVIEVKASGIVSAGDYQQKMPELASMLEGDGRFRFYIDLMDMERIEPGALLKDLKFDLRHKDDYGRIAVVGDSEWEERAVDLFKPFLKEEIRYFGPDGADEAREWINAD